jgi:metal-responsive CopG/Arc/MetJ family transcriptional regulator
MSVDKEINRQVLVTFPKDLLELIENYWHDNKLQNRNEAIRELVKIGLSR